MFFTVMVLNNENEINITYKTVFTQNYITSFTTLQKQSFLVHNAGSIRGLIIH